VPCHSQTFEIPLSVDILSGEKLLLIEIYLVEAAINFSTSAEQCDETQPFTPAQPVCQSEFSAISLKQRKKTIYNGLNDAQGNLNALSNIKWLRADSPSASVERYTLQIANTLSSQIDITKPAELNIQFWRTCTGGKTRHQRLSKHCAQVISVLEAE